MSRELVCDQRQFAIQIDASRAKFSARRVCRDALRILIRHTWRRLASKVYLVRPLILQACLFRIERQIKRKAVRQIACRQSERGFRRDIDAIDMRIFSAGDRPCLTAGTAG